MFIYIIYILFAQSLTYRDGSNVRHQRVAWNPAKQVLNSIAVDLLSFCIVTIVSSLCFY